MEIEEPRVKEMRASAKLVYSILKDSDRRLSSREIAERAQVHKRTARDALSDLEAAGVVVASRDTRDARKLVYEACTGEHSPE